MTPHGPVTLSTSLEDRLFQRFEALGVRLERLYPDRGDVVLARIADILRRRHAERSAELRALDDQRLANPDWFLGEDRIGYACYVDRFAGRLADITPRLPHLKRLHVTYLHLLPLLKMRAGADDGGFAVSDYGAVDARFGTMADLRALTAALRREGVSLCIDLTLNHTADDHAWAQAARAGDAEKRAYYHVLTSAEDVAAHEAHLVQVFPETAPGNFTRVESLNGWVWTTFYPFQWDLNYANPDVLCEILTAMLTLANAGAEIIRLDSVPFLWKRRGVDCRNLPEAHLLLEVFRLGTEIAAPGVLLKSEAVVETREAAAYFGAPQAGRPEAHLAYNNSLMVHLWAALAESRGDAIRDYFEVCPPAPPGAGWINYIRCHDDIGWGVLTDGAGRKNAERHRALGRFYGGKVPGAFPDGVPFQDGAPDAAPATCGMLASLAGLRTADQPRGERELAIRRIRLLHGLIACLPGAPVIYMGDEIGQTNDADYLTRDRFCEDRRGLHRPPMDWATAGRLGDADLAATRIHADLAAILSARVGISALNSQSPCRILSVPDARLFAASRGAEGRGLTILANLSSDQIEAPAGAFGLSGAVRDRLDPSLQADERTTFSLAPYALHWFEETG